MLTMASFLLSVPESSQYQSLGSSSSKWNAAIVNVINSTCAFPVLPSQNICSFKLVLHDMVYSFILSDCDSDIPTSHNVILIVFWLIVQL